MRKVYRCFFKRAFDLILTSPLLLISNSIDTDGVKGGFDLPLLARVLDAVRVPVIASGGAGGIGDFVDLFKTLPEIDAGLAASIFHFGEVTIPDLKRILKDNGINVRL